MLLCLPYYKKISSTNSSIFIVRYSVRHDAVESQESAWPASNTRIGFRLLNQEFKLWDDSRVVVMSNNQRRRNSESRTESDEKAIKKKLRNRQSAQRARDRQKARMHLLEIEVQCLIKKNQMLLQENNALRSCLDKKVSQKSRTGPSCEKGVKSSQRLLYQAPSFSSGQARDARGTSPFRIQGNMHIIDLKTTEQFKDAEAKYPNDVERHFLKERLDSEKRQEKSKAEKLATPAGMFPESTALLPIDQGNAFLHPFYSYLLTRNFPAFLQFLHPPAAASHYSASLPLQNFHGNMIDGSYKDGTTPKSYDLDPKFQLSLMAMKKHPHYSEDFPLTLGAQRLVPPEMMPHFDPSISPAGTSDMGSNEDISRFGKKPSSRK